MLYNASGHRPSSVAAVSDADVYLVRRKLQQQQQQRSAEAAAVPTASAVAAHTRSLSGYWLPLGTIRVADAHGPRTSRAVNSRAEPQHRQTDHSNSDR